MEQARRKGKLTNWQLFTLVFNSMLATGIYTIARTTLEQAGRDFWLSILLAVIFSLLQLTGMYLLSKRFPEQSLAEYAPEILGKWLGAAYLLGYFAIAMGLAIVVPRNFWAVVSAWVYRNTPQYALMLPLALVCWNVARRGVVVLSRISEMLFALSIPIIVMLLVPHNTFDFDYLLPVLDKGPLALVKGVLPAYFSMTGFDILLFVYPFTSRQRVLGTACLGVTSVGLIYAVNSMLVVGTLSPELTLLTTWPLQQYLNHFASAFLERIDIIVLVGWALQVIMTITIPLFIAGACLRGVFPRLSSRRATDIGLVVLLIGVLVPIRLPMQFLLQDYYSLAALFYAGLLPIGLWLLAIARRKGGQCDETHDNAA
jgi:spore germination protein (amino acid permease)